MATVISPKLKSWINEIDNIDSDAAVYLAQRKWSKAIMSLYNTANFGPLTPEVEINKKQGMAVVMYKLSKEIKNKKGMGLALSLLARHLMKDQNYELAYRFLLQTRIVLAGYMDWIGIKEDYSFFPPAILEELEGRRATFNDAPDSLITMFIEKYRI
jgi:hypothetical protein